jgi:hypothetical protein
MRLPLNLQKSANASLCWRRPPPRPGREVLRARKEKKGIQAPKVSRVLRVSQADRVKEASQVLRGRRDQKGKGAIRVLTVCRVKEAC